MDKGERGRPGPTRGARAKTVALRPIAVGLHGQHERLLLLLTVIAQKRG